jgi:SAM-dependent methyltransferase
MYTAPKAGTWHTNPLVFSYICRRSLGVQKHWLYWMFENFLTSRPRRLLSIGCGDGAHELIIARKGFAGHVDAFDASEVGIVKAREIAQVEGLSANFYVDTFEGFIAKPVTEKYDAVLFVGSLHHVVDLDGVLTKVREILTDDGCVIYNEYVGPCYIVLPDHQVKLVNRLLAAISPEYKIAPDCQWTNPGIETVMATDPSEAVRSALIPHFLRLYFDIRWEAGFGGTILHPIFQFLNSDRLTDGSPGSNSVVELLIAAEEILMDTGVVSSDFSIGVCDRKKSVTPQ